MRRLIVLVALFSLAACDSGRDDPPEIGHFEAEMTGDLALSLEGDAVFSTPYAGPEGEDAISITMIDRGSQGQRSLGLTDFGSVLTGVGTYTLGDVETARGLQLLYLSPSGGGGFLMAVEGTVRVTRFEEDGIEGTFSARLAAAFVPKEEQEGAATHVEGTFEAVRIEVASY